jgi:hypothetical protein
VTERKKTRAYTRKPNSTANIYSMSMLVSVFQQHAFSKHRHSLPYTSYKLYSPEKILPSHPGGKKKQTHDQIYSKRTVRISS